MYRIVTNQSSETKSCGRGSSYKIVPKEDSYLKEIVALVRLALPVCCTFLLRKSIDIVSLIYVGRLGPHFLSAAGIALVTYNVTGNSLIESFGGALSTICSQAYGSNDMKTFSLAPWRAVFIISLVVCIPVSFLWIFSSPIMVALGQVITS